MIDFLRKQQLDDCFFQDNPFPSNLSEEERDYVNALSRQWDYALLSLYGKIMQRDRALEGVDE